MRSLNFSPSGILCLLSAPIFFNTSVALSFGNNSCTALASSLQLENTTILDVSYVAANTTLNVPGSCQDTAAVSADLCRIYAQVNTTDSSSVKFEMWLPDDWYGRFITLGNGGLGGCIDYSNLAYVTSFHFAAIGSDNGHDGNTGVFFLNHPEVINDFAWRAVHVSAELGKQITEQYYTVSAAKNYYLGCSTGGRQGMQSALKFPADFDGIIAGSPAVDFNHLLGWAGLLGRDVGAPGTNSSGFIPDELFPVVTEAILEQCDLLDGVQDGIITEPDDCFFDPTVLLCGSSTAENDTSSCLTADQILSLNKIYSPVIGTEGQLLYPRYDPLTENATLGTGTETSALRDAFFNGTVFFYTTSWYQNTIYNDTNYTFENWGVKDIEFADTINPGGVATFDGNLSAFRDLGGKLVTFHGRFDGLIASGNSKRWHNLISSTLTPSNSSGISDFYRLFLVPGMSHCMDGPGAWQFGQSGSALGVAQNDSEHNVLLALVDWVEGGVVPQSIMGTETDGETTREHCMWPAFESKWNGTDWICAAQ